MKGKFFKSAGILLAAVLFACLSGTTPTMASTVKLNYANFPPASTFPCVQMERWKEEVEKRTEGKVSIYTFPGSTLLGAKNMIDGVIAGQADIGCFAMSYHPGRFPVFEALDLPMEWPNATVASMAMWDLYEMYKPKSLSNVKVLTMFTCPPANVMSIKPVRNIEDLKGMEIRASGTGVKVFKLLGASPVGMPQSDVPDALHKSVINGIASSLEVMKDCNYAEYCRYITITNLQVVTFAVVMNLDKWNALPEDVKKVMDDLAREQCEWTGKYVDKHVEDAVKWSKEKYGVEIIHLSLAEAAKMRERLEPLADNYIERTASQIPSKEIINNIIKLKDKYSAIY